MTGTTTPPLCRAAVYLLAALVFVSSAGAQELHGELVASGLTHPVALVQDPADSTVQLVAEQTGHIRRLMNGVLQDGDYLDLSGIVSSNREGGLLGLAFAPDYATSGRIFVNFTDPNDNTVIARFTGTDLNTRFDLVWPDGNAFIYQPYCCHYGGHLAFGSDGYLYIALGDGGAWDDPDHNAQNPASLLGKLLRIDVAVGDDDARGYRVPGDNPFVNQEGVFAEIWDAGLRNPWRYTFDDPSHGGTGALIIADVGQDQWEEFDYEPAGRGGRNYGWRNREGANDYIVDRPPWFEPLTDPTYQYPHDGSGKAIIGGYVYRGTALGSSFAGRYFFGDFMSGQLWSAGLTIDPNSGEASVTDLVEHTDQMPPAATDYFTTFGQDADGELYLVSWWHGTVYRLAAGAQPAPGNVVLTIEAPIGGTVSQPFVFEGFALDPGSVTDSGVDYVQIWARRHGATEAPALVGTATSVNRPDLGAQFGLQFASAGFTLTIQGLSPDVYDLTAFAHSSVTQEFAASESVVVQVGMALSDPQMSTETPPQSSSAVEPFQITGWAIDRGASSGTGVTAVHVWAFRTDAAQAPMFVGQAQYGAVRSDIATTYGAQFANSGFSIVASGLPAGNYDFYVFMLSTVTGTFNRFEVLHVSIVTPTPDPLMEIDALEDGSVSQPFEIGGWAIDHGASSGTGVTAVHVWAFRTDAPQAPIFIGQAQYGIARPDVGATFGSQFTNAGFSIVSTSLPPGTYDVYVFMHSTVTGTFNRADVLHVVVVTPTPDPQMTIDAPQNGASVSQPFAITGWAIDHGASMETGVNAVHVWALRADAAQAPIFVGQAQYGDAQPQVGAMFGGRFTNSGYSIVCSTLPPGVYDVYVFAHSSVSGTFNAVQAVHLIVQ